MVRHVPVLLAALLAVGASSCGATRYSSSGFRLPPAGNVERGKTAFLALGCHTCHAVFGSDLPHPTIQPPVPVVLGGPVSRPPSDGYLVTSIIYPSYQLPRYPASEIVAGGRSRMPDYADRITVQQLTDIVEFVQAHYKVERATPTFPYY